MSWDIANKTVLITGGNSGIGKATATALAEKGAQLVLGCRNLEKAEQARVEITQETGNENVKVLPLDLASFDSIRSFAAEIRCKYPKLDVLINNAGVIYWRKQFTDEGFEGQFGTNYLGHFLLTHLLLDQLEKSAPARIINVASTAHFYGKINFDNLRCEQGYGPTSAYFQSKLANVLFTKSLAKAVAARQISVFSLHPGTVATNIFSLPKPLHPFMQLFLKSPKKGAATSVYLATTPDIEELTGSYFVNCKPHKVSSQAEDERLQQQLWDFSEIVCGIGEQSYKSVAIM